MSIKSIYFSRFFPEYDRGGGSRRMMQILNILSKLDGQLEVVSSQRKDYLSLDTNQKIEQNISLNLLDNMYKLWSEERRWAVYRLGEISRVWSDSIPKISQLNLAVLDDPIFFEPLLKKLELLNIPVLGICHNLETLVPDQIETDPSLSLFNKEINLLTKCKLVITISREENFLLNNLGIKTMFFPYYPVIPIMNRLLKVRKKRSRTYKRGILLLGTALNPQTRQGMKNVIHFWQSSKLFQKEGKLLVAGYGTSQHLNSSYNTEAIEFFGTLSNDKLDNLLYTVRACLCFQEKGAGALTRICEMLIAGVPVLANSHVARSYYNTHGVIEFQNLDALDQALKSIQSVEDRIPIPESPNSFPLLSEIQYISNQL